MTENEKMLKGLWYDANFNQELLEERDKADELSYLFNHTNPSNKAERERILGLLLPNNSNGTTILAPFYTDYGYNCFIGQGTFINRNVYMMDGAPIRIGERCLVGPNSGFYTAEHPLNVQERASGLEIAKPIVVEDDVWIGADVTILQGVTIGKGSVIGAKSLVTKDVPPNVLAYGNPCKVIRIIKEQDKDL